MCVRLAACRGLLRPHRALNVEVPDTLLGALVLIERRRRHYNAARPHSALGYRPPAPETVLPWPSGYATLYPEVVVGLR